MAWIEDLSPVTGYKADFLAIGWLERGKPFATGPVDEAVYVRLVEMVKDPWRPRWITMGFHRCDLCLYEGTHSSRRELYIPADGFLFVCPELIVHYMNAHWYRPPDEFCRAVVTCPPMRSMPYLKALLANGGRGLVSPDNE